MPAPAVYILAIVGTVGAVLAFKEFVYEPHIAPRIDQWKAEYEAARRRRAEMVQVALVQRGAGRDDDGGDDDDLGKGSLSLQPRQMKNGLLIRRRSERTDIELDDLKTGTTTATDTGSQPSDFRSIKKHGSLHEPIPLSPTNVRFASETPSQAKTTENLALLDQSIQPISYTPLSPIRTPTPTHVLYNTPSPFDSPFSTQASVSLAGEALPKTDAGTTSVSPNIAESSPRSPPGLKNNLSTSVHPISPSPLVPPSPPSQSLSSTESRPSPSQTPHIHAIPSLSQSYPLDDLLDYEHGLELLSPPSPLSRTDSPFEFAGFSPRPEIGSTLLLAGVGDRRVNDGMSTDSTRSVYLSFPSSPALSATSDNGYENDSNRSEFSSTFSSPMVAPSRLGLGLDLGSSLRSGPISITPTTRSQQSSVQRPRRATATASDNGSELSDLDFLNMSAEEYEALTLSPIGRGGGTLGLRSRSTVMGRGGAGRPGNGGESDTSSWSLAEGSE